MITGHDKYCAEELKRLLEKHRCKLKEGQGEIVENAIIRIEFFEDKPDEKTLVEICKAWEIINSKKLGLLNSKSESAILKSAALIRVFVL